MTTCTECREFMSIEREPGEPIPAAALAHLETCAACRAFKTALDAVDAEIGSVSEDEDAPEDLVHRTLERVRSAARSEATPESEFRSRVLRAIRRFFTPRRAATFAVFGTAALVLTLLPSRTKFDRRTGASRPVSSNRGFQPYDDSRIASPPVLLGGATEEQAKDRADDASASKSDGFADIVSRFQADLEETRRIAKENGQALNQRIESEDRTAEIFKKILERMGETGSNNGASAGQADPYEPSGNENAVEGDGATELAEPPAVGSFADFGALYDRPAAPPLEKSEAEFKNRQVRVKLKGSVNAPLPSQEASAPYPRRRSESSVLSMFDLPVFSVDELLKLRSKTDVPYQSSRGYWRNTYVPGDPDFRQLLESTDVLTGRSGNLPPLSELVRRPVQPFDYPENAGIGLSISSDHRMIDGKSRMLVQVGIQGARRGGARPPLKVAVVLDLRHGEASKHAATIARILHSLDKQKLPGDSLALFAAGKEKSELIALGDFRHGSIELAIRNLGDGIRSERPIAPVLRSASESVMGGQQSTDPLGAYSVMLVTASSDYNDARSLAAVSHESAVRGVPVSVLALETGAAAAAESIALAGQGNRQFVFGEDLADAAVKKELSSLSRVVARALRLNIRLAEGVHLVGVVGSERLDNGQVRAAKAAEESIDRRLSSSMGITSDRGMDDDGIQILIPAFYSDDHHTILLDVVADRAGPIAEVSARFKDILYLRNGTSREALSVQPGSNVPGRIEASVLKTYLALQFSRLLKSQSTARRPADLEQFRTFLRELPARYPVLRNDEDLARDMRVAELLAALEGNNTLSAQELSKAFELSARLKISQPLSQE